jgi:peptide-methionine (R)-S-oxide reductase
MGGRSHQDDGTFPVTKSDGEWRAALTEKQYSVLREHGTEFPGTSPLLAEHREGTFVCAGCGQILFDSATKFESGSGWPSFWSAVDGALGTAEDGTLGMRRTEIYCARCGGHLGHVFPDGPKPTGLRYCTNGAALKFEECGSRPSLKPDV